jgi:hypothetical protein
MRIVATAVALILVAPLAAANDFATRARIGYEFFDINGSARDGLRQTYDLRLDRALTGTSSFRIFFRGDDFRGSATTRFISETMEFRQIQPGAELMINTPRLLAQARGEYVHSTSQSGRLESGRSIERAIGSLTWTPDGLPVVRVLGQRNRTKDDKADLALTDDTAMISLIHEWRGFHATAGEHYARAADPRIGYDRTSQLRNLGLGYNRTFLAGKLTVSTDASSQRMRLEESGVGGRPSSVPTPVAIGRVLYAIDETPLDGSDTSPLPNPALNDGDINASAGVSLGPDATSFQNLILDISRVDRADEIRVIVRDDSGNLLRNGGAAISWDVYTSVDGRLWTPVPSTTTFDSPLSLYSVSFSQTAARWLKVVNFGVQVESVAVTEVQAYYHTTIEAGETRKGNQAAWNGNASVTWQPIRRLTLFYSGLVSSVRQEIAGPLLSTRDVEHFGTAQYDWRLFSLRGQYKKRDITNLSRADDGASGLTAFIDFNPTRQLRISLEAGNEDQVLNGAPFTLETRAVNVSAFVIRSFQITLQAGTQTQEMGIDGTVAHRRFVSVTSNVQLAPSLRLLIQGTLQRSRSDSDDPAVLLLGPERDDRVSADVIWRPGRKLSLSTRIGWFSGQAFSGATYRYHAEWYPFGEGTVSLAASHDEDIDPILNRRATRTVFNPRWAMNRFAAIDINYTAVTSAVQTMSNRQRSLLATLTLRR